ncbi:MAG: MotA/TolQ/ExbB proton channel family protein [Aquabacterium sp.]
MNANAQPLNAEPVGAASTHGVASPAPAASDAVQTATQATVVAEQAPQQLGFAHFIAQTDAVGQGLFVILVLMSVISWGLIVTKGVALFRRQRRSRAFLNFFWNATSLQAVQNEISTHGVHEPFGHLTAHAMHAQAHHARFGSAKLEEAGSAQEFLTRTIKKVLDEETMRMESGLSVLATIGATAPFVGLFGTVWGVYHALLAIGATGAGTLDKVAGPVGEALIMTGVGLAVAIPAVMGYNWLTRNNRVWGARLDAFAFELFTFLSTGQTLKGSGQDAQAGGVATTVRPLKPNAQA